MRISTFKEQRGFKPHLDYYEVFFNGKYVNIFDVLMADEEERILVRLKRYPNGTLVIRDGDSVTLIERGDVKIRERSNIVLREPEEVPFQ